MTSEAQRKRGKACEDDDWSADTIMHFHESIAAGERSGEDTV